MKLKTIALLTAMGSLALSGCNGSSSSSSSDTSTISGTASAPSGSVAMLQHKTILDEVLSGFISPAYASMTGLEAVENALVELIEIDDEGNQVGDVIASTYTSTTGSYSITIPDGYELNGSLVLRITGSSGAEMRAQAVDDEVDINPISEYMLSTYIELGVDLSDLTLNSVVELYGQLDEYDLSASTDLTTTLAQLKEEVGEYVTSSIEVSTSSTVDANELDGNYRLLGYESKLTDRNTSQTGETYNGVNFKSRRGSLTIDGDTDGNVDMAYNAGTSAYRRMLTGSDGSGTGLTEVKTNTYSSTDIDSATYKDGNVIVLRSEYEELLNTDEDEGERTSTVIHRYQKVKDSNIAVNIYKDATAYYNLDSDNNIVEDYAIGHDVYRGLRIMAEVPTDMDQSDLTGTFGRVYLEAYADENANIGYLVENNILTFDGSTTFTYGASSSKEITRDTYGSNAYETDSEDSGSYTLVVDSDGNISQLDEEYASDGYMNGFINADYNFLAVTEFDKNIDSGVNVEVGTALAVKLPTSTPTVKDKTYRLMMFAGHFDGQEIHLFTNTFDGEATFTSQSAGTVTSDENDLYLAKLGSEDVTVETEGLGTTSFTASIASNGATTITTSEDDGSSSTLNGYFNQTASMGVFTYAYNDSGEDPKEVGLVILIEIDEE